MRKPIALPLVAALLAACGGGGGGGDGGTTSNPPPNPPPAFELNPSTTLPAANAALRGVEEVVVRVFESANVIDYLLQDTRNRIDVVCRSNPTSTGTIGYNDNDGNAALSVGDSVFFDLALCEGVETSIRIAITTFGGEIAGHTTFEMTRSEPTTHATGAFDFMLSPTPSVLGILITGARINLNIGGFVEIVDITNVDYSITYTDYALSFVGTLTSDRLDRQYGFGTDGLLRGSFGGPPSSGHLRLTTGTATAVFEAPTGSGAVFHGEYRIDTGNGSGFGAPYATDWSTLVTGALFGWYPGQTPLITRLEFEPPNPTAGDPLVLSYAAQSPTGAAVNYEFAWRHNGVALNLPSQTSRLEPGFYRRGDTIDVTLRATSGNRVALARQSVSIRNAAPSFSGPVTFVPPAPYRTQDIAAIPTATDIDGDAIRYTYAWRVNGTPVANQTDNVLPAGPYARNDVVTAVITASDDQDSTTRTFDITVTDAPPTVTAVAPPVSSGYGLPLTFDTNVADPDGDSVAGLRFALEYGPAGMTVDPISGRVAWQPTGPMFDKTLDVHWSVTVDAPVVAPATGTITVTDPARRYPLLRTERGAALSPGGFSVGDFDGDGRTEALVATDIGLYELVRDGAGGYRQSWVYPFAFTERADPYRSPDITAFATGDIDGDGKQEIFVASEGRVARLDGVERRVAASGTLGDYVVCADLQYGDLDRDGAAELVCLTKPAPLDRSNRLIVLRASDLTTAWTSPTAVYGARIALGDVDGDAPLEIVTAGGHVIDGRSRATEWLHVSTGLDFGFGFDVHTADLDGDGIAEIVTPFDWTVPIRVYDARTRTLIWQVSGPDRDYGALETGDIDGDGKPEIIVGNQQYGSLTAYKVVGNGAQVLFQIDGQQSITGIGIGDIDADGSREIVWSNFGMPRLVVASRTGVVEWQLGDDLAGPYFGGQLAGGPLQPRRPVFGSVAGTGAVIGTRLVQLEVSTGTLQVGDEIGTNYNRIATLLTEDFDLDGTDEAVLTTGDGYWSRLIAYDPFTRQTEWSTPLATEQYAYAVAIAKSDLTGDGRDDVVSISASGVIEAHDMYANTTIWRDATLAEGTGIALGDLDADGEVDIVALTRTGVALFERRSPSLYEQTASYGLQDWEPRAAVVADGDGDGNPELFVLGMDRNLGRPRALVRRLGPGLSPLGGFALDGPATTLAIEPSATPRHNLVVATERGTAGTSHIVALDSISGHEIWRSPLLRSAPWSNSLSFVTLPGETAQRLTFGTELGIYVTR